MHYAIRLTDEDEFVYIHDTIFSSRKKLENWAKEKWSAYEKVQVSLWVASDKIPGIIEVITIKKRKVVAMVYPVTIE